MDVNDEGWLRWEPCEPETGRASLSQLTDESPRFFAGSRYVEGRRARLPFYDDYVLLELCIARNDATDIAYVLYGPRGTEWLNGESSPIHEVNEYESLALSGDLVESYLRFFLHFLRSDQGAFVLIESPEQLRLEEGESAETKGLSQLRGEIKALTSLGLRDDRYEFDGTVAYANALFHATFAVATDGNVEMIDDHPVCELVGIDVPQLPKLTLGVARPSEREITEVLVGVLLEEALQKLNRRDEGGSALLRRFNDGTQPGGPIEQFCRLIKDSNPIVILESEIPFVEDFVAGQAAPHLMESGRVLRGQAILEQNDDLRCQLSVSDVVRLYLLSFHTYRTLFDVDRVAHELSLSDATVLIGCERLEQVPDPFRRIADLEISFPSIDRTRFARIFERIFHEPPSADWDDLGFDWTRYLVVADFYVPRQFDLPADEAVAFLRERVEQRLQQVSPDEGPSLSELHGLGEARQVAEDLILDIQSALAERIPWSAVDKGMLLVGAPGTGKTTLARAIAKECGIKIVISSAARWQSAGYLDAHLRAMRADFAEARRYAPAILFLDEIDSIGNRETFQGHSAQYQTEVVNAMLEEVQGIVSSGSVILVAATNYPEKVDPALRRAGRLDQVVTIPLPSIEGLERIFEFHLSKLEGDAKIGNDVDLHLLAFLAFGLTGADVEFFVRGAARRARHENRPICQADLVAEVTRRPRRPDSAPQLGPSDLHRVAVHEAGHALARVMSSSKGMDLAFISIIPRMDGTLGFVASAPTESQVLTRRTMLERLETTLAGRAAEAVVFGPDDVSTGAGGSSEHSDLAVATGTATYFVCQSGLGGPTALLWTTSPSHEQTARVNELLDQAYNSVLARLELQRELLLRIADVLKEKQEMSGDELRQLVRAGEAVPSVPVP